MQPLTIGDASTRVVHIEEQGFRVRGTDQVKDMVHWQFRSKVRSVARKRDGWPTSAGARSVRIGIACRPRQERITHRRNRFELRARLFKYGSPKGLINVPTEESSWHNYRSGGNNCHCPGSRRSILLCFNFQSRDEFLFIILPKHLVFAEYIYNENVIFHSDELFKHINEFDHFNHISQFEHKQHYRELDNHNSKHHERDFNLYNILHHFLHHSNQHGVELLQHVQHEFHVYDYNSASKHSAADPDLLWVFPQL